ncbi:MAG TPA: TetR family transcriptional regulator [Usitatibacter sp.]
MRRSKEDSLKTRRSIVLAARRVFARRGVSQTSMEQIACAAGVTRGAVYGHFKDKGALFQTMREQVRLPLMDVLNEAMLHSPGDPLAGVERYLLAVVEAVRNDPATRDTFQILIFKCEYVGDFAADIKRQSVRLAELAGELDRVYRAAARLGQLRKGVVPRLAALETCAFLMGTMRLWLLDRDGTLVRGDAAKLMRTHMANLRAA